MTSKLVFFSQVPSVQTTPIHLEQASQAVVGEADPVDALIAELSATSPAFAQEYVRASQFLAPLADVEEGITLTSLRMKAGLTQHQFAQAIGQRQSNVSLMESGKRVNPNRETMRKMCGALGCDMTTLDTALENSIAALQRLYAEQEAEAARAHEESRKIA
jgi:transcriptional regulator with XRE-family HTH domain